MTATTDPVLCNRCSGTDHTTAYHDRYGDVAVRPRERTQRIYDDLGELVRAEPDWATTEIERLRSRLDAIVEIAESPINEFETPLRRLDMILRLALGNGSDDLGTEADVAQASG